MLPVNGSREALFALAQTVIDPTRPGATVVCPNPFYQIYEGAALLAGAQTAFANSDPARNFAADWAQIADATWARTQLLYVCSPGNPTGAVMPLDEWKTLFELSDRHGFVIATDECYSEIYFRDEPPLGSLAGRHGAGPRRLPQPGGLHQPVQALQRARACARASSPATRALLKAFLLYRTYHGSAMSPLVQRASIAAWNDEAHVRGQPRAVPRASSPRSRRCWPRCSTCALPDAGFYLWAARAGRRRRRPSRADLLRSIQCDGAARAACWRATRTASTPARGRIRMALVRRHRRVRRGRAAHRRTSPSLTAREPP